MESDVIKQLLGNIGRLLAEDKEFPLHRTLLYAKVTADMVSPSIFKDCGYNILYREDVSHFMYPLLDLWEASSPNRHWAEMEYFVEDGKFTVSFTYKDQIDSDEDEFERRDRIVAQYFGDRPIVYPPWDNEEDGSQTFEL